jgi:hypothetical protein
MDKYGKTTDGMMNRETNRKMERQAVGMMNRGMNRKMERQTE